MRVMLGGGITSTAAAAVLTLPTEAGLVKTSSTMHWPGLTAGMMMTADLSDTTKHDSDTVAHTVALHWAAKSEPGCF